MIEIAPLQPHDHDAWEELARGYKTFYKTSLPDSEYDKTWQRLMNKGSVFGLAARLDSTLVGIAHFMFHTSAWSDDSCYLQDLYVDERVRGRGVARALIEEVARVAKERDAPRLYWLTQQDNTQARSLYDKLARFNGFIRYDYVLS